jgi:hypothetical protein
VDSHRSPWPKTSTKWMAPAYRLPKPSMKAMLLHIGNKVRSVPIEHVVHITTDISCFTVGSCSRSLEPESCAQLSWCFLYLRGERCAEIFHWLPSISRIYDMVLQADASGAKRLPSRRAPQPVGGGGLGRGGELADIIPTHRYECLQQYVHLRNISNVINIFACLWRLRSDSTSSFTTELYGSVLFPPWMGQPSTGKSLLKQWPLRQA